MYVPSAPMPCSSQITYAHVKPGVDATSVSRSRTTRMVVSQQCIALSSRARRVSTPSSVTRTSQNFAPIWFPHCPAWMCTISLRAREKMSMSRASVSARRSSPHCSFDRAVERDRCARAVEGKTRDARRRTA